MLRHGDPLLLAGDGHLPGDGGAGEGRPGQAGRGGGHGGAGH